MSIGSQYENCKKNVNEAKSIFEKIERTQFDSSYFLFKYFQNLKSQVESRRNELKEKIDDVSDEIIDLISVTQNTLTQLATESNEISRKIEASKVELNRLVGKLNSYELSDIQCNEIERNAIDLKPRFNELLEEFEGSLTGNNRYEFKKEDIEIKEIFGKFLRIPLNLQFKDSAIVHTEGWNQLMDLCQFDKEDEWLLLYRASVDGFSAQSFHSKCDGISDTLTIIKSNNHCIFGGYTTKAWASDGEYKEDSQSFIFSLINKENFPFKAKCVEAKKAILCHRCYGPTFGAVDFFLQSNSNQSQFSRSNFGYSYSHQKFPKRSVCAKNILAGEECFQTIEIEIYCRKI